MTKLTESIYSGMEEVDVSFQDVVESFVEALFKAEEGIQVINKGINQMTTIREDFTSIVQAMYRLSARMIYILY